MILSDRYIHIKCTDAYIHTFYITRKCNVCGVEIIGRESESEPQTPK